MALNNIDVSVTVPDVDAYFNIMLGYADSAIASANTTASQLSNFYPIQYSPTVTFEPISTNAGIGSLTKPTKPVVSLGARNLPASPSISTPALSVGTAPTLTTAEPTINLPAVPSPLDIDAPLKDFTITTDFDYPVAPTDELPTVPTLIDLSLPTLATIDLPVFDLDFPTSNSLVVPGMTFSFSESAYSSDLLTSVKGELLSRLSGGTGLSPVVEQAIWDRGRDREQLASLQAERALLSERSQTGFSRPSGAALSALDQIVQDTQSKLIDLSREIMIKQAELEQENIKTSIQQTIALEDILVREYMAIAQRSFEVAKYIQDTQIEIFKMAVSKYTSEVEAYKSFSIAYTSRVQAELSKVEIFKAEIDAQKLIGDINEQNIKIYLAQLDGIKTNVETYKILVETVSERLKAEGLKLEIFKADIDAYAAQVKAKADEFSIYSEQIKGELAKVEVFDSSVKAFTSRIQAYASQADVSIKKAETETAIQGLNVKKYEADVEAFIKQVQADQLIYQSAVDIYRGESQLYIADAEVGKSAAELSLKNSENTINQNKHTADIAIENARITLASLQASYNATLEGKKAAGSIYQAIGSSSLAAVNVSAQLQGSTSIGASESHNYADQ
jgi:hypothetical protein